MLRTHEGTLRDLNVGGVFVSSLADSFGMAQFRGIIIWWPRCTSLHSLNACWTSSTGARPALLLRPSSGYMAPPGFLDSTVHRFPRLLLTDASDVVFLDFCVY